MTRVGWLYDRASYVGGAELTEREFRAAAPDGVEIVDCPPGDVPVGLDTYVIHNCVTYSLLDLRGTVGAKAGQVPWKLWNDVGSWLSEQNREFLDGSARPICISPLQADYMGLADDAVLIPPPVDLSRFYAAADRVNGNRADSVCVASWRNRGKGAHRVLEWAAENEPVEFYGAGAFAPQSARPVEYDQMPDLLARYQTFVYLPEVIEPFGRCVAEAWAAGCEIVTNKHVGASYWIREKPEALETAAEDFWKAVLS